ncbi:MAG TPA: MFS transporter [Acidobacteriaceae bacterium]|nr:MFS transporter [Acidobacteriaceae bacterium]
MLLLAVILAIFVYGMTAATLGTILPNLSERFQLTPSQNGMIAFAQALGLILASLAVGPLLDAEGKKVGLVLGLACISLALLGLPRCRGYKNILFLLFLLGIGGGIVITGANALASDVGEVHRASTMNLVNLFFGLGGFVTPFIAANFFAKKWIRLCYTIAGFSLVALLFEIVTRMPGPNGVHNFVAGQVGHVLGRPSLFLLGFFLFLYVSCEVGVWNWLPRHLIAQGIPESRALNILSIGFALGLLLGRVLVTPVLIHISAVTVVLVASSAMAVTTYLMLRTRRPTSALILVGLAGISMAPVFPTTLAIVGDAFPQMTSTAIGFAITCGWVGLAVSSRVIGWIAGGDPRRLNRALMVIPVSAVLMIILSLVIRVTLHS